MGCVLPRLDGRIGIGVGPDEGLTYIGSVAGDPYLEEGAKRMRRSGWLLVVTGVLLFAAPRVSAQVRLGPELTVADNVDFGIGARAFFPIPSVHPNMEIGAFLDIYFPGNDADYFEVGGTWYYLFPLADNPNLIPKVGAGMTVGRWSVSESSRTDVGLHLLGGLEFPLPTIQPFIEAGAGLGDIPDFFLRGGISFRLGGSGG